MTSGELIKKYPKIFTYTEENTRMPFPIFGIECGDGWLPIIDLLCENLQFNTDHNNSGGNEGEYPQIVVTQVKEKFGGLRFYVNSATEKQYAIISFTENLSYHFCEQCGKFSHENLCKLINGWYSSKCDNCRNNG